jgi:hypothetical protein
MAYFGIYMATVMNTADPETKGRMQVTIPVLSGPTSAWALPCRDYKSTSVPPIGTSVWVMFEAGNVERPVWMGCAN